MIVISISLQLSMSNRICLEKSYLLELFQAYQVYTLQSSTPESLESQYQTVARQVAAIIKTHNRSKHTLIRLESWLKRLQLEKFNQIEAQNRNNYLKLLHLMVELNHFIGPFRAFPSHQEALCLTKHQYRLIFDQLKRNAKRQNYQSSKTITIGSLNTSETNKQSIESSTLRNKQDSLILDIKRSKQEISHYQSLQSSKRVKARRASPHRRQKDKEKLANLKKSKLKQQTKEILKLQDSILQVKDQPHVEKTRSNKNNRLNSSMKRKFLENKLPLSIKSVEKYAYWESVSVDEKTTPKYLSLYPSHPFASLALQEEDIVRSHRQLEQQNCTCFCSLFEKPNQNYVQPS